MWMLGPSTFFISRGKELDMLLFQRRGRWAGWGTQFYSSYIYWARREQLIWCRPSSGYNSEGPFACISRFSYYYHHQPASIITQTKSNPKDPSKIMDIAINIIQYHSSLSHSVHSILPLSFTLKNLSYSLALVLTHFGQLTSRILQKKYFPKYSVISFSFTTPISSSNRPNCACSSSPTTVLAAPRTNTLLATTKLSTSLDSVLLSSTTNSPYWRMKYRPIIVNWLAIDAMVFSRFRMLHIWWGFREEEARFKVRQESNVAAMRIKQPKQGRMIVDRRRTYLQITIYQERVDTDRPQQDCPPPYLAQLLRYCSRRGTVASSILPSRSMILYESILLDSWRSRCTKTACLSSSSGVGVLFFSTLRQVEVSLRGRTQLMTRRARGRKGVGARRLLRGTRPSQESFVVALDLSDLRRKLSIFQTSIIIMSKLLNLSLNSITSISIGISQQYINTSVQHLKIIQNNQQHYQQSLSAVLSLYIFLHQLYHRSIILQPTYTISLYPSIASMSQFGKQRLSDFYSDPNYINVNHGSYGLAPKIVIDHQRALQERCDHNTERWFRVDSEKLINQAREYIAKQIKCPAKNVYIVNNATDGINCLAKSLTWKQGDVVLLPNTAYACVRKTFNWLRQHFNITIQDINFTAKDMQSPESFQLAVENFVNSYPKQIKLAVFDHIISVPGYVCPVEALVEFFRQKKIPCFIDGAHAINQETVDMSQLQPDAYFSNFHKWSYAPKTAAFLYLSDAYLNIVQPALTGNFHGQGPARQYYWCGTRDYSAFLSIRKGLEYSQSFGQNAVRSYNHGLAVKAALRIAEIWGTEVLTKDQRCVGYMANVRVPSSDLSLCVSIAYEMMDEDNCFPIFYQFDGKVYTRISAQIYNQLKDYEFMAQKFKERLEKKMKGKEEEKMKGKVEQK